MKPSGTFLAKLLFLVPARGGSKGFPGKNLALLAGIPLVGRVVRTAREVAGAFPGSRVICSTDDPSIAAVAKEWGADVPFVRPSELATDEARTIDVVLHALDALGGEFDAAVVLQPTSPLTAPHDVRGAVDLFLAAGAPVASVCRAEHPIEWYYRMDGAGRLIPVQPESEAHQRQKLQPSYRPNGSVYVASPAQVRRDGFWTPDTRGYAMPAERSVDVDSRADLEVARAMLAARVVAAIEIAGRKIGPGHPCFVIAEAGVNHNGSLGLALRLVDAAADAGADAVKFQTFKTEAVVTRDAPKASYQKETTGESESQFEMVKKLELTDADHRKLLEHSRHRGLTFLSTPFDERSADFLESLQVPAFKIASGELTNLPFLRYVARKGRPLIISTGMASLKEVDAAASTVRAEGLRDIVLLHCVSAYPADPVDANLRAMETLSNAFCVPVGYSDHTTGIDVALAAVALGACVLEKHFTLDRTFSGPDHKASIEPEELASMIRGVRRVGISLGDGHKRAKASEENTRDVARRSLFSACKIPSGTLVTESMIAARRPGFGMPPSELDSILGLRAEHDIPEWTLLRRDMFEAK